MNILGIETSCDETAASVVKNGKIVLSNIVVSSLKEHQKYGGVIPEIASRRQLECLNKDITQSLSEAHLKLADIDRVAVTVSPGLIGSLLVGISFARALSFAIKKPLIEMDHIHAHLYANFLIDRRNTRSINKNAALTDLPAVGLVVSGGHTSLYAIKNFKHFKLLGQTRDDAAGEAFDKVAKILNLGYPGGPAIDHLAKNVEKSKLQFPCAELKNNFDFSFSGIKTSVLYHQRDPQKNKNFSVAQVAFAFQNSLVEVLVKKSIATCQQLKNKILLVGGGVAANSRLRKRLIEECERQDIKVYFPPISLCMDNAAMIAGLAYHFR